MEGSPARDTELEWQLDAQDLRPVQRWIESRGEGGEPGSIAIGPGHTVSHVDTYLDTDDRRLDRAGYSVRVRQPRRGAGEATLKSLGPNRGRPETNGPRIRLELTEEVDGDAPAAVAAAPGPVGEHVRALAGARPLAPLFDVETRRRIFPLAAGEAPSGELALDDTTIKEPGGKVIGSLRRVEVEAPAESSGLQALVDDLRSACGLQQAVLSKYEAGLVARGLGRVEAEELGPTGVRPQDAIGQVGLAVLRRQFAAFLAKEPGTRLGEDIEELHDMRVASRRMRAAVALFGDSLPAEAARLGPELAWVGRTIGAVRDLDVQLVQLDEWVEALPEQDREPLERLRVLLEAERADARAEMLAAFDSARYGRFVRRFGAMLRSRTGTRTAPALEVAPDLLEARHRAVRKAGRRVTPDAPAANYHRLRIAGKRLRYALEFLADVYPGATGRVVRRTVALQDLLGTFQDADVAIGRLRALADERGVELGPGTVFAMGEIAERYRHSMDDVRKEADAAVADVGGKVWRRLRKRLEADRPDRTMPASPPTATVEQGDS
jgi:triphosphatase